MSKILIKVLQEIISTLKSNFLSKIKFKWISWIYPSKFKSMKYLFKGPCTEICEKFKQIQKLDFVSEVKMKMTHLY